MTSKAPPDEVDPTRNVLDLVKAANKRQDDLRTISEQRQDDLRTQAERFSAIKHKRSREIIKLNARHAKELRKAETKRLDAIREVDVSAASLIANQVSNTAEALRALVSTTAETLARQTTTTTGQLSDRIASLERSSYEGSGKSAVADPMTARMIETLEQMRLSIAQNKGREGLSTPLLMTLAAAVAGLAGFIIQTMLRSAI